jgi:hypothetical protein
VTTASWRRSCDWVEPKLLWLTARMHWFVLAAAIIAPLWISRYILNSIIPCAFLNAEAIRSPVWEGILGVAADKNGHLQCSFTLPSTVYAQLYEFGAGATICVVLAIVAIAFAIRYVVASAGQASIASVVGRCLTVPACLGLAYLGQTHHWINPHSCISIQLIDLSTEYVKEDTVCVEQYAARSLSFLEIGGFSKSLKDIFNLVYPLLIAAAALTAIATCYVIGSMARSLKSDPVMSDTKAPTPTDNTPEAIAAAKTAETAAAAAAATAAATTATANEKITGDATRDIIFLLTLLSGLFTFFIIMTNSYYTVGDKVLSAALAKPAPMVATTTAAPAALDPVKTPAGGTTAGADKATSETGTVATAPAEQAARSTDAAGATAPPAVQATLSKGGVQASTKSAEDKAALASTAAVTAPAAPDPLLMYRDYVKAVGLHWGAGGSATIAMVFFAELVIIAYWRERARLPPFADFTKLGTMLFNLLLIGLPTIAAQAQAAVKF